MNEPPLGIHLLQHLDAGVAALVDQLVVDPRHLAERTGQARHVVPHLRPVAVQQRLPLLRQRGRHHEAGHQEQLALPAVLPRIGLRHLRNRRGHRSLTPVFGNVDVEGQYKGRTIDGAGPAHGLRQAVWDGTVALLRASTNRSTSSVLWKNPLRPRAPFFSSSELPDQLDTSSSREFDGNHVRNLSKSMPKWSLRRGRVHPESQPTILIIGNRVNDQDRSYTAVISP